MNEIKLKVIGEIKENSLVLIEKSGISRMQKQKIGERVRKLGFERIILMFVDDPQKDAAVLDIGKNSLVLISKCSINREQRDSLKETTEKMNWPEFIFTDDPKKDAIILDEKEMNEKGWYRKPKEDQ